MYICSEDYLGYSTVSHYALCLSKSESYIFRLSAFVILKDTVSGSEDSVRHTKNGAVNVLRGMGGFADVLLSVQVDATTVGNREIFVDIARSVGGSMAVIWALNTLARIQ